MSGKDELQVISNAVIVNIDNRTTLRINVSEILTTGILEAGVIKSKQISAYVLNLILLINIMT